jgi:hypothetical protein
MMNFVMAAFAAMVLVGLLGICVWAIFGFVELCADTIACDIMDRLNLSMFDKKKYTIIYRISVGVTSFGVLGILIAIIA